MVTEGDSLEHALKKMTDNLPAKNNVFSNLVFAEVENTFYVSGFLYNKNKN